MTGLMWYFSLAAIGIGMAVYSIYKKGNFAFYSLFYIFTSCVTFTIEFFVLVVFEGYIYKPGIVAAFFGDSILGHVILNTTLWPGTAVMISAFSLRFRSFIIIITGFVVAEYLFIRLGIYEQNWWKLYTSAILVYLYCVLTKMWFNTLKKRWDRFSKHITLFFVAFFFIQVPSALLMVFGKQYVSLGWTDDMYRNTSLFLVIYHVLIAFSFTFFTVTYKKWHLKLVPILIFLLCDSLLIHFNILHLRNGWSLLHLTAIQVLELLLYILYVNYISKHMSIRNNRLHAV